jgi:hypothetical protein
MFTSYCPLNLQTPAPINAQPPLLISPQTFPNNNTHKPPNDPIGIDLQSGLSSPTITNLNSLSSLLLILRHVLKRQQLHIGCAQYDVSVRKRHFIAPAPEICADIFLVFGEGF